jgi:quercetin dioxygenase-like cupin family protein
MFVRSHREVAGQQMGKGVTLRWVISEEDAESFCMRIIEAEPGSQGPPLHSHPYEHEMYILEGQGILVGENEEKAFKPGDVIFVPSNEKHQLAFQGYLKFI